MRPINNKLFTVFVLSNLIYDFCFCFGVYTNIFLFCYYKDIVKETLPC